ncbi:MAG: proteasome accessory factor PafA2 family protein [Acidimicrobiia bacterium]
MAVQKIVGLENEYGFAAYGSERGERVSRISMLGELAPELLRTARIVSGAWKARSSIDRYHLPNGGLIYCDTGNHPEYATPECLDVMQLIAADRAGDRLFASAIASLRKALPTMNLEFEVTDLDLYKHNADFSGNTFGTHENYCASSALDPKRYAGALLPFLSTRPLIAGSGGMVRRRNTRGYGFVLSPRALYLTDTVSNRSTLDRPMFNLRDEPLADRNRFRRIHLLCGDANRCDVSTLLKIGTTAIVLAMIEDDFVPGNLSLVDPVKALHQVSNDPNKKLAMADGTQRTALEIQYEYCERAYAYADGYGVEHCGGAAAKTVLQRWGNVLDTLRREEWHTLFGVLDWPTKRVIFERRAERLAGEGAPPEEIRRAVAGEELSYSSVVPERSTYEALRTKGRIDCLTRHEPTIAETAPDGTRAKFRATVIAGWPDAVRQASWDNLTITEVGIDLALPLSDPRYPETQEVHALEDLPSGMSLLNAFALVAPRRIVDLAIAQRDPNALSVIQRLCERHIEQGNDRPDLREACYESGRSAVRELAEQVVEADEPRYFALLRIAERGFVLAGCPEQLVTVLCAVRERTVQHRGHQIMSSGNSAANLLDPSADRREQRILRTERVVAILDAAIASSQARSAEHPAAPHVER